MCEVADDPRASRSFRSDHRSPTAIISFRRARGGGLAMIIISRAPFFVPMIIIPPPQTSAPQRARPSRLRETRAPRGIMSSSHNHRIVQSFFASTTSHHHTTPCEPIAARHPSSTDERAATPRPSCLRQTRRGSQHHVARNPPNRTIALRREHHIAVHHIGHIALRESHGLGPTTRRPTRHNRPEIRRHSLADHLPRFHHIALLFRIYHITPSHHTMRAHRGASPRKAFPLAPRVAAAGAIRRILMSRVVCQPCVARSVLYASARPSAGRPSRRTTSLRPSLGRRGRFPSRPASSLQADQTNDHV